LARHLGDRKKGGSLKKKKEKPDVHHGFWEENSHLHQKGVETSTAEIAGTEGKKKIGIDFLPS